MLRETGNFDNVNKLFDSLKKGGAFLVAGRDEVANPMTIGWATVGIIWGKPVLTVLVRPSRHTFSLISKHDEFVVCVPEPGMSKELSICGTRSGRDIDKFAECGFTKENGLKVSVPHIAQCPMHYECRIVHRNNVSRETLINGLDSQYYPDGDFHTVFYGEMLGTYLREKRY